MALGTLALGHVFSSVHLPNVTYLLNKLTLSTKLPIDSLTDNIVERLKFSLVERSFYNRIYERNPQNSDFVDLPFDGDQRLIAG